MHSKFHEKASRGFVPKCQTFVDWSSVVHIQLGEIFLVFQCAKKRFEISAWTRPSRANLCQSDAPTSALSQNSLSILIRHHGTWIWESGAD